MGVVGVHKQIQYYAARYNILYVKILFFQFSWVGISVKCESIFYSKIC